MKNITAVDRITRKSLLRDRFRAINLIECSFAEGGDYKDVLALSEPEGLANYARSLFDSVNERLSFARWKHGDDVDGIKLGSRGQESATWRTPAKNEQNLCQEFLQRFDEWAKREGLDNVPSVWAHKERIAQFGVTFASPDGEGFHVADCLADAPDNAGDSDPDNIEKANE